uniref:Uncharacterized protein n=1 Tax=Caenorhabditis japonica TaxID=281687 RepID=A0A8R1DT61_CAEJA
MDSTKEESDDDGYIPAGLVNKFEKDLDGKDMRNDEIMEFYNTDKLITSARPEKSTTEVFADLSEPKPVFAPKSTPTNHPYRIVATRQQPLPFVPRTDLYRSNRPIPRLMQHRVIQPVAMPVPPMLPVPIFSRPMLSQGSVLHYSLPNSAPPKMQPQLQIYNPNHPAAMQPPIFAAYPTEVIVVSQAVPFISHATKMLPYEPKVNGHVERTVKRRIWFKGAITQTSIWDL